MASVASLVRGSDGYMKFIDYQSTYKDNNKEFLRGDMWELQFINVPKINNCLSKTLQTAGRSSKDKSAKIDKNLFLNDY